MPEKLFTIKEVAEYLEISEEEVKRLVDIGEIPAYKIGGSFLRFRKEQLDAIRSEVSIVEKELFQQAKPAPTVNAHPYTELEKEIKRREPITRQYDYTFFERIKDFFYFNDFYLLFLIIISILLFMIFKKT